MVTKMMDNRKYKILLIEDDKVDQMAFKRLVQNEGLPYDYTIAGSVAEAGSILGSERFDFVITDYRLGDGTAFDILHLVKNTPPQKHFPLRVVHPVFIDTILERVCLAGHFLKTNSHLNIILNQQNFVFSIIHHFSHHLATHSKSSRG